MTEEEKKSTFTRTWTGIVLFGAISAFFASPLLRYVNPVPLTLIGMGFGLAAWSLYRGEVLGRRDGVIVAVIVASISLGAAGIFALRAIHASHETDLRCSALQSKFIDTPLPDEKAATAFAALGCRPQFKNEEGRLN